MKQSSDQRLAEALRRRGDELNAGSEPDLSSASLVSAVAQALDDRARQRRRAPARRWALAAAAIAAMLLAAVTAGRGWRPAKPGAEVLEAPLATAVGPEGTRLLSPGARVVAGDRLRTPAQGSVVLRFEGGTTVSLGAKTDLELVMTRQERRFSLREGHFSAAVAKLKADERFVVDTVLGAVEVRGTRFEVDLTLADSECREGRLAVSVSEGVVAVSGRGTTVLVHPGEQHTVGCLAVPVEAGVAPPQVVEPEPKIAPPGSSLAKLNAMYARGLYLKRAGKPLAAAAVMQQLRREFPGSALDEAAAVEELRLLELVAPARAREAAAAYITAYPDGYGRDIAARLLQPPRP